MTPTEATARNFSKSLAVVRHCRCMPLPLSGPWVLSHLGPSLHLARSVGSSRERFTGEGAALECAQQSDRMLGAFSCWQFKLATTLSQCIMKERPVSRD